MKFKCVPVFHIRKDVRPGVRALLGYSPKCKSSIANLRNIFLISQNLVNSRENAYESGDHHCDLLANYRSDINIMNAKKPAPGKEIKIFCS